MIIKLPRPITDIIICLIWSIIIIPIVLATEGSIRIILGLPFLLFIPGYLLSLALFPLTIITIVTKIGTVQRIALSFALSLAIIPIIGSLLNYTTWGLQIIPILIALTLFNFIIAAITLYNWFYYIPSSDRIITEINLTPLKLGKNLDTILTILLGIMLILTPLTIAYVLFTPRTEKPFTEFYILNQDGLMKDYHRNLSLAENTSVIIGIANHEYKTIDYTIEVWLLNQTTSNNTTTTQNNSETDQNNTEYNQMWYIHKINKNLDHTQANIEKPWTPQWEYNYTFNINRTGNFKLFFLLYTQPTETYTPNIDYITNPEEKINNSYASTNLWLNISHHPRIYDTIINPKTTLKGSFINISAQIFDADGINNVSFILHYPNGLKENLSILNNKTGLRYYCNRTYSIVGDYMFFLYSNDTTNNKSKSNGFVFSITDIPIIIQIEPYPIFARNGSAVNISYIIYDGDGLTDVAFNLINPNGIKIMKNRSIINNQTNRFSYQNKLLYFYIKNIIPETARIYYFNYTYTSPGKYQYSLWVEDARGNTKQSSLGYFQIIE